MGRTLVALAADIDRNSLFKCRGRAPDKSAEKQRFHALTVPPQCSNASVGRQYGALGHCPGRGAIPLRPPHRLDGGRVAQMNAMNPCDILGDLKN